MQTVFNLISALLLLLSAPAFAKTSEADESSYYYVLNTNNGLSDNHILQMMQLPDGRMAIRTKRGVDIYDGRHCRSVALDKEDAEQIAAYLGHIHMYADNNHRLWVKSRKSIHCIDLKDLRVISMPLEPLRQATMRHIDDLFVDGRGAIWTVSDTTVARTDDGFAVTLKAEWGELQDMDADTEHIYTFHSKGIVAVFDGHTHSLLYTLAAYSSEEARRYNKTSLAVRTPGGQYYQLRTDNRQSVLLHFDPTARKYERVFNSHYILHTLNMPSDNQALVSSQRGYLMFDFRHGNTPTEVNRLSLPDGTSLVTGINTVCRDADGGIWLGTYNNGVIYVSPYLGLFFTAQEPWWKRGGVWLTLMAVTILAAVAAIVIYRRHKDTERNMAQAKAKEPSQKPQEPTHEAEATPALLTRCTQLVEEHLQQTDYGVEQLAADLCMERTGLYKKLTTLTDDTPVTFIRNIRLRRAAELLRKGQLSAGEVAALTGFASPSYFAKCFKAKYGVKPSEYV